MDIAAELTGISLFTDWYLYTPLDCFVRAEMYRSSMIIALSPETGIFLSDGSMAISSRARLLPLLIYLKSPSGLYPTRYDSGDTMTELLELTPRPPSSSYPSAVNVRREVARSNRERLKSNSASPFSFVVA